MKTELSGRTAAVTGAGGAIGRSIALGYASNGAYVAVCDIDRNSADKTVGMIKEAGGNAAFFHLDVTDKKSCMAAIGEISAKAGKPDILVNNAGVNVGPEDRKPVHEFDDSKWDWIMSVDLNGVYNCSRAAIPYMIEKGGGAIINISSIVGLVPLRNQCAFAAAKAGVINLTRAMALELAQNGIRVNAICPGSIMMEGTKKLFYSDPQKSEALLSHIPLHRPGTPEDIAYAALYLGSDEAGYVTGSVLTVDGGWTCGFARDF
jgi:NAD(P)-dependent dehydrogenase (short-subunit alcohol dehydrogenase family)